MNKTLVDIDGYKEFPTLFKTDQNGSIRQWKIWCDIKHAYPHYNQEHGLVGGKLQQTSTKIKAGKNIGRANETSAWQQCVDEAQSLWNKQLNRKGYSLTKHKSWDNGLMPTCCDDVLKPPMLAKMYNVPGDNLSVLKDGYKIKFPCFVQGKLDGARLLALVNTDKSITLYSRQLKESSILTHISSAIQNLYLPVGTILDGELYLHGEDFQSIISAVKRDAPSKDTCKIQYHIYDYIADLDYEERYDNLSKWIPISGVVRLVQTLECRNHQDVEQLHKIKTGDGYEGIMLRNKVGPYKSGGRSYDLQKVKKFYDMEFKIVDAYKNKGKSENECTLVCETQKGVQFGVKPQGSETIRQQYWLDWQIGKLKGKYLTVRFFSWTTSDNPVPRFPIGVEIR